MKLELATSKAKTFFIILNNNKSMNFTKKN